MFMADQATQTAPAAGVVDPKVDPKAVDPKADPKAAPEQMFILKVNGKEEKVPLSKLIERAQKSEGAEVAMQKAAQMEKAFNNFASLVKTPQGFQQLLSNPALGVDKKALLRGMLSSNDPEIVAEAKNYLFRSQVVPTLPEDQRNTFNQQQELEDLRALRSQVDADKKKQDEIQKAQQVQQHVQAALQKNLIEIRQAITSTGLPETEPIIARIARYSLLFSKKGTPKTMAECAAYVKNDLQSEWQSRLAAAKDDDELLSIVPEDLARRINAALLKKMKGDVKPQSKSDSKKPMTPQQKREWLKNLERGSVTA
jgi:hypothetical protein